MKAIPLRLVILVAGLTVCAGCRSSVRSHKIDVILEPEPGELPVSNFKVGIGGNIVRDSISKIQLRSADSNGLVRFDFEELGVSWVWQARAPHLSFALYVPAVSTNGSFHFRFDEVSRLPTRGLKQGKIDIRPMYIEFDRWNEGWRNLPVIRTEVMPYEAGGVPHKTACASPGAARWRNVRVCHLST